MTQKKLGKLTNVYTRGDMRSEEKNRYFFIRTYLPKEAIEEFVNVTCAYAFIEHNAEQCKKHFHVLCKFENARSLLSVGKMFSALSKKYVVGGAEQSTFVEIPTNKTTAFDYLTHSDTKSKKQGKHQYSNTEVESDNVSAFVEESAIQQTSSAIDILDDINKGVSFREMACKYGKGFVVQYSRYKEYATRMSDEESPTYYSCSLQYTINEYLKGNCSAVILLRDVLDTIAFDLHGSQHKTAETCAKSKEFDDFIDVIADVYLERTLFYKGLDKVADIKLYDFDTTAIARSRGVTDAVKNGRNGEFGGVENA